MPGRRYLLWPCPWWEKAAWWCNNHLEKYESQWEGGIPTPLKNDGVRQLGWWHSQYVEKKHVPNHQSVTNNSPLLTIINHHYPIFWNGKIWKIIQMLKPTREKLMQLDSSDFDRTQDTQDQCQAKITMGFNKAMQLWQTLYRSPCKEKNISSWMWIIFTIS